MKAKPTKSAAKPKLYHSIGEVSAALDVKAHVVRYWETQFAMLRPKKNRAGNRMYRPEDIELLKRIKELLYTRRFTIEGARQRLTEDKKAGAAGGKRVAVAAGAGPAGAAPGETKSSVEAKAPPAAPADGEAEALRSALAAAAARESARAAVVAEVRDALKDLARQLRERADSASRPAETSVF